jgi:hypothetical protein
MAYSVASFFHAEHAETALWLQCSDSTRSYSFKVGIGEIGFFQEQKFQMWAPKASPVVFFLGCELQAVLGGMCEVEALRNTWTALILNERPPEECLVCPLSSLSRPSISIGPAMSLTSTFENDTCAACARCLTEQWGRILVGRMRWVSLFVGGKM